MIYQLARTRYHFSEAAEVRISLLFGDCCGCAVLYDLQPRRLAQVTVKETLSSVGEYVGLVKGPGQCKEDIVEDAFLVLWDALADARTQSTLFVWSRNVSSPQVRFSVRNDALIKVNVS